MFMGGLTGIRVETWGSLMGWGWGGMGFSGVGVSNSAKRCTWRANKYEVRLQRVIYITF